MIVIFREIVSISVAGITGIVLAIEDKMVEFARCIYLDYDSSTTGNSGFLK